jgi:hypothetical protein
LGIRKEIRLLLLISVHFRILLPVLLAKNRKRIIKGNRIKSLFICLISKVRRVRQYKIRDNFWMRQWLKLIRKTTLVMKGWAKLKSLRIQIFHSLNSWKKLNLMQEIQSQIAMSNKNKAPHRSALRDLHHWKCLNAIETK